MYESSFPLWAERGIDGDGYFYERLDPGCVGVSDQRRRIRVQARQTYSFALACALGWRPGRAGEIARHGAHMLVTRCALSDGLYGSWLDVQAGPEDRYCLYDCVFVLLALCWAASVLGDQELESRMRFLAGRIDADCCHPSGGYRETSEVSGLRLQNPHMHFVEASLAQATLWGDWGAIERAGSIEAFVMERFFDQVSGGLVEEWSDSGERVQARNEAGHHYEWTWLLHHGGEISGGGVPSVAGVLYRRGCALTEGDGRIGLAHGVDGTPLRSERRMWCLCEAVKAHLVAAEQGDSAAVKRACDSFDLLWSDHLCDDGSWIDTRDKHGVQVSDMVPASSGYHVYLALVCLMRAAGVDESCDLPIAPGFGCVV